MTRVGWGGSVTLESNNIGAMGAEMRWDGGVRRRNGGETSVSQWMTVGDAAAGGGGRNVSSRIGGDGFRYGPGPGDTGSNGGMSTGGMSLAPSDSICAHSAAVQSPNVSDAGSVILSVALDTAYCHCLLLVSLSSICRDKVRAAACASSRSRCRPSAAAAAVSHVF
jgi:hypothetical protein